MKKILLIILVLCIISVTGFCQEKKGIDLDFVYTDGGRRDPFWPLLSSNGSIISYNEEDLAVSDMVLQGITVGDNGNIAVINGKIVVEGGMVGAFKVERIMPAFVVLDNGQEKIELHLSRKGE